MGETYGSNHGISSSDGAQTLIGIADSHESSRESISSVLSAAGYGTAVYESVEAFLHGEHKSGVRCLVVDLDIPGLSNVKLKHHLAQLDVSTLVIFVTSRDTLLENVALYDGAGAVLAKPFTYWALLNAIRSALDFA
jgi:FixJ family two-component response regulator